MAKFVAKRRNISFEGCAFKNFGYNTNDINELTHLRSSKFYNNGFIEIDREEITGISLSKPLGKANKDELKKMLATMESEEVKFEKVDESLVVADNKTETITNDYSNWEYNDLKIEAKEKGMKWTGFPKKIDLIEYLNGTRT